MIRGVSSNRNCSDEGKDLKESGIEFVGRYYSSTAKQPEKKISVSEALFRSKAGLHIIVFYQDRMNQTGDFSKAKGKKNAMSALDQAKTLGKPAGSTIYFAVDYDPSKTEIEGPISDYFRAVRAEFADAGDHYKIGVYRSGFTSKTLISAGLAEVSVLSQSKGFRASKTFLDSKHWTVNQSIAHSPLRWLTRQEYEPSEVRDGVDFGAFQIGPGEVERLVQKPNLIETLPEPCPKARRKDEDPQKNSPTHRAPPRPASANSLR